MKFTEISVPQKRGLWSVAGLLAFVAVISLVPLPNLSGSHSSLLAQGNDALRDFMGRSPGERGLVLASKGKGKGDVFADPDRPVRARRAIPKLVEQGQPEQPAAAPVDEPSFNFANPADPLITPAPAVVPDSFTYAPPVFFDFPGEGTGGGSPGPTEEDEEVTGAVPEPSTWMMMILGFGLCGASMRRRSQGTVKAVGTNLAR